MAVCHLGCHPSELKQILKYEGFEGFEFKEVRFPITSTTEQIDLLIVGSSVKHLTRLAATVSDWKLPPATLCIIPPSDFAKRSALLTHHPRVGRNIFLCQAVPDSIEDGLTEALRFYEERAKLEIDNEISGSYTINNVSPRWLFQTLMKHLDEYIYFKDRDSKFLAVSRYLAESCGKDTPANVLGLTDFDLFDEDHAQEAYTDERKIATGMIPDLYKEERIVKNGRTAWVASRKLPLHTRSKFLAGSFGLSRDITESKELMQELENNHERMQAELLLAKNLQFTLINQGLPDFVDRHGRSALEIATKYIPSFHLSGDFFSIVKTSEHGVALLVADVMGHGVRAAMVTAMIQIAVQQLQAFADQPSAFMHRLNNMVQHSMQPTGQAIFATAAYCHLNIETRELSYVQAGARHGIYVPSEDETNAVLFDKCSISPALGLLPDSVYSESKIELNSGDELLLYTDGIIEAAIGDDEYSEDRLVQFLTAHRRKKLSEMMESLLKSVQEFTHSEELQDDVCLVGLRLP